MLPSELCLDANVFVSSMIQKEENHAEALKLLQLIEENNLALFEPKVVLFEVGSAIHRKRLLEDLTDGERDDLIDLFFRLPLLFQWQSSLMIRAASLAKEFSSRGISDSCYIALAERRGIPLISFDADLIKRGRRFYRKIYSVSEFLLSADC